VGADPGRDGDDGERARVRYPELYLLVMAFNMTVRWSCGCVIAATGGGRLEMTVAMIVPGVLVLAAYWLGVSDGPACGLYCGLMDPGDGDRDAPPARRVRAVAGENDMRVVHVYTMRTSRIGSGRRAEHAAYWKELGLPGYLGGPFGDRSGGLITFEADSIEDAARLIEADPFVREGLLEETWMRQWLTE
jgi:uncharacterized protein YciI